MISTPKLSVSKNKVPKKVDGTAGNFLIANAIFNITITDTHEEMRKSHNANLSISVRELSTQIGR